MPEIMSGDIQAILKNLHARITALESNNKQHLGTTPDFWPLELKSLYENLKKVGWQLDDEKKQEYSHIAGRGYKKGTKYSIEIQLRNTMFQVDCWESPADEEEQPECISQMCNNFNDVKKFLNNTFPS